MKSVHNYLRTFVHFYLTVNNILSVKQGKEHGLGIRRVKELVEKADGVLQITSDNKIFSVHIMIPDKENDQLL